MEVVAIVILAVAWQVPQLPRPTSALDKLKAESAQRDRCNPKPVTPENRRQALAVFLDRSQEAAAKFPNRRGFRDRAMVYAIYGPPDKIETNANAERWAYDCLDGKRVVVEFSDKDGSGDCIMSPLARQELLEFQRTRLGVGALPAESRMFYSHGSGAEAAVEVTHEGRIEISLPLEFEAKKHAITAAIVSADGVREFGKVDTVALCQDSSAGCRGIFRTLWQSPLPPDAYILSAAVEDAQNSTRSRTYVVNFSVTQ
jgi:hypothetical protein